MVCRPLISCKKLTRRENWNWKQKVSSLSSLERMRYRANDQNYIRSTKPHSRIGFKFTTSLGTVQLQYLRSAIFGLGSVKCWVDEDVEKAVNVIGYWKEIVNIGRYVFHFSPSLFLPSFLLLGLVSFLSLSSNQDNDNDNDNGS
jgi:hypothetical protein